MVYLIHFETPYKHARHYIGFAEEDLDQRMKKHKDGLGAKLMRAVTNAGIKWFVARLWKDGSRTFERELKNRKNAKYLCPVCNHTQKQHLHEEQ
jgi:predicted GIY-YIG superfamily endonuclease